MNKGLGRGLSSLIPNIQTQKEEAKKANIDSVSVGDKDRILKINPKKIKENPHQPRKDFPKANLDELMESIKEYGIIQPVVVSLLDDGGYELIAGERRLRASVNLGLNEIPAIIRDASEQEKFEIALIENLQREDLNPIEVANAYKQLQDEFGLDQQGIAKRVGKSRSAVTNVMRMLDLPDEIQEALRETKILEGHAKYIAGLDSPIKQKNLFRKIVNNKMSVKDTAKETRMMGGTKSARIKINYKDSDREIALQQFFGARVEIRRGKAGGEIAIKFNDDEELRGIVEKVS